VSHAGHSVVIVDDAEDVRLLVRMNLELSKRFDVIAEGGTGLDAIELAEAHRPDVLLLDLSMPEMDGWEALPRVLEASPETRVVVLTGFDDPSLADRARDLGATSLLRKAASLETIADDLYEVVRVSPPDAGRRTAEAAPGGEAGQPGQPGQPGQRRGGRNPDEHARGRKVAEEALRRSEERFRLFVEAVKDYAIFMLDRDGHVMSWNAGAQRLKGYRAEEILGRHFRTFYPPEKQAERHPEHELELALRDGAYEEEGWRVRKDGTRFWANVVITAVHDSAGNHLGFAKVTRDVTDRRDLLNSLSHVADERAQFLAVTAHELRSPIGVISGAADLLRTHWTRIEEGERKELLDSMTANAARLRRLLDDLLTAARLEAGAVELLAEDVMLAPIVTAAVAAASRGRAEGAVIADVAPDLVVRGDPGRVAQMVDNLVSNGLEHGKPPVEVAAERVGANVEIRVSDSGAGVRDDIAARLFDRFATTRQRGGTGLGLFIIREMARAHGGDSWYEPPDLSERRRPTFVVSLPAGGVPQV
jgi:PAS domain S-box-containing protein